MTTALTFQETNFEIVERNGQTWLTSTDIAKALGFKRTQSVTQLFNRNKDEFTDNMTLILKMSVKGFGSGSSQKPLRIFSLRGAHLLAMFAKTAIAKEFRKWVLDILDKEVKVERPTKSERTTTLERTPLKDAVNMLVAKRGLPYPDAYKFIHHRFGVEHLDQLTKEQLPQAVEYVHKLILEGELLERETLPEPVKFALTQSQAATLLRLLHSVDWVNFRLSQGILSGLAAINPKLYGRTVEHVQNMARDGRMLDRELVHIEKAKEFEYMGGTVRPAACIERGFID